MDVAAWRVNKAGRVKYRLRTIAYVFALLAAGMAAFGAVGGSLSAAWVAGVWMMLHAKPARAV